MKRNILIIAGFLFSLLVNAQNDEWNITRTNKDNYTGVSISNGRIGLLTSPEPFKIKHTVLNNVYDVDPVLKVSQIVHGTNTCL